MFDPPLHVNAYGFMDDDRSEIYIIPLQYGCWGFRRGGGALHSYPTKVEATEAFWRMVYR